ncbi:TlpA family protein disulfide reductase [Carboxylicivirga taeanensis]|uniref:TlpA family protein disulfide reductase n=1 Tax=Carboxylicivirga taeanensis TaxID=1416875 RepID=UPI003F6DEBE5
MKQTLFTIFGLALICAACTQKPLQEVHLKGTLKNFSPVETMRIETPEGYILRETVEIKTDSSNFFDITIPLDHPTYFRLGRNTLYLSPGDDLTMEVDLNDPNAALFNGTGAEANRYLRAKPFPKGGSYIPNVNLMDHPDFDEVIERLEKVVENANLQLDSLRNVSEHFKKLEKGRIQFDAANTLQSYGFYASWMKKMSDEDAKSFKDSADTYFKPVVEAYLKDSNDPDYLHLDTYRGLSQSVLKQFGTSQVNQELVDFIEASNLCYGLASMGPVKQVLEQRAEVEAKIQSEKYKRVIGKAFHKYEVLEPGNLAPNLTFSALEGQQVRLSDFKGQMVVIDVWATWCGPCKNEAPFFEELAQKYSDKPIHFISISIDSNKKAWQRYLDEHPKTSQQFICNRSEFKSYELFGVPRFIVIDNDGKFIDAFAPAPSNPDFEKLISEQL